MRRRVVLDPEAIGDIEAIDATLRRSFGDATAERSISKLLDHLGSFELFPERGRRLDALRRGLRAVGYRRTATIVFRIEADRVTIVRVLAAGRDIRPDDL